MRQALWFAVVTGVGQAVGVTWAVYGRLTSVVAAWIAAGMVAMIAFVVTLYEARKGR